MLKVVSLYWLRADAQPATAGVDAADPWCIAEVFWARSQGQESCKGCEKGRLGGHGGSGSGETAEFVRQTRRAGLPMHPLHAPSTAPSGPGTAPSL